MNLFGVAFKPERYAEIAKVVDKSPELTRAIQSRFLADKNVARQLVSDAGNGIGISAVNEHLAARFNA
jgi:hypothetical protein